MLTVAGAFGTPQAINCVEGPLCELWPAAFVVLAVQVYKARGTSPLTLITPGGPEAESVPIEVVHSAEYAVIAKPLLDPGFIDKSIQDNAPETV